LKASLLVCHPAIDNQKEVKMDNLSLSKIAERIQKFYPKGTSKVSSEFVETTIATIIDQLKNYGVSETIRKQSLVELDYYRRKSLTKKGLSANDFYHGLDRFIRSDPRYFGLSSSTSSIATQLSTRDSAFYRLEKEIQDLRSMIVAPDIEQRLKDLQAQIESIQRNTESIASVAIEAAEDLLQKFTSAENKVFVIMPFRRELENVWLGAIKPACNECHYASLRVDEVNLSSLITDDIERFSNMADVVIVDITDNNPNVMFEFGWALAKNKKPIVICQGEETSKIPFDIRGIRYIAYENSWLGIENLKKKIKEYLQAANSSPVKRITRKKRAKPSKTKTASKRNETSK
jgi:hypothetical protein